VIVDTSALAAIVFQEPGHERLLETLATTTGAGIGTPTVAELGIVLAARLESDPHSIIVRLLDELGIDEIPFGDEHWREALAAFVRFGRGRHPARLNFGDCLTYAVARLADEPLLFVGDDFMQTDLTAA
jgi:ribonuclease VapC